MPRIALIVDDDPATHEMLTRSHEEVGLRTVAFFDAESALTWLETAPPPEVITTDQMLPGMPGLAFIRMLRARPGLAHTPVILASAHPALHDAAHAGQLGAVFLSKPFRMREYL